MKNEEIPEMIRGWTDSRLALEIDQAAAHAVDTNRSNDSAFAATAMAGWDDAGAVKSRSVRGPSG